MATDSSTEMAIESSATESPTRTVEPTVTTQRRVSTETAGASEAAPRSTATATSTWTPDSSPTPRPETPTETEVSESTATPPSSQQSSWTVTVVRIVDGDTFEVRFEDGRTEDVRLLGVDTPEVHAENDPDEFRGIPDTDEGREWLRDWGHRASEYARAELSGETVRIETDSEADRRGSYGRLLVYLTHDGDKFNEQLLRQGYARMYDSSFSERSTYENLESTAQRNDVGLWGFERSESSERTPTSTETPVPDGGGGGNELVVAEINEDAQGNDHDNLDDEYIVFENTGETAIEMGGWRVSDEADHTYTVPQGVTLEPGARVTLYTGSGDDSESELYWGSGRAVWNNNGDTIYVYDDGGTLVIERSYS